MPSAAPPTTSTTNSSPTCHNPGSVSCRAIPSSTVNTTTPTPSLNSDSPSSAAFKVGGTRTDSKIPSTAMGSVGLISAPNTNAHTNGSGWPAKPATTQMPQPTSPTDSIVPTVAKAPTVRHRHRSAGMSTCSAPANSRKLSMPCISNSWKSMRTNTPATAASASTAGSATSASNSTVPTPSPMSTRPIVGGALRYL